MSVNMSMSTASRSSTSASSNGGGGALKMRIKVGTKPPATSDDQRKRSEASTVVVDDEDGAIVSGDDEADDEDKKKKAWACKYCDSPPFDSDKALYGHMRLHNSGSRERRRKKVHHTDLDLVRYNNAHEKRLKTGTAADGHDDVLNAAIILMSFANPTEYSRGRFGFGHTSSKSCDKAGSDSTEEDIDASLIISSAKGKSAVVAAAETSSSTDEDIDASLIRSRAKGKSAVVVAAAETSSSTEEDINASLIRSKAKGKSAAVVVAAAEASSSDGRSNTCRTCGKSFPTYQALGGHMTKHKQDIDRDEQCSDQNAQGLHGEQEGQGKRLHCCSVCNKKFEKGQSLGGHMRKHWVRPGTEATAAPPPSPPSTTPGGSYHASALPKSSADVEEEGAGCRNRAEGSCSAEGAGCAHDFDLNESP